MFAGLLLLRSEINPKNVRLVSQRLAILQNSLLNTDMKNTVRQMRSMPHDYARVFHGVSMSPKTKKALCISKFNLFYGTLQN